MTYTRYMKFEILLIRKAQEAAKDVLKHFGCTDRNTRRAQAPPAQKCSYDVA
jgi:hypothetical protein